MQHIELSKIEEGRIKFYSDTEERHYALSEYQKHLRQYAQLKYPDANIEEWDFQTIVDTLYNSGYLFEFEMLFTSQNQGLIYFKGKSKLTSISVPLCRDFATLKNGVEIEYSLYNAVFENGLSGKTLRNFTFKGEKPQEGKEYNFEYSEKVGKYNRNKREFYINRNIKIIHKKSKIQSHEVNI